MHDSINVPVSSVSGPNHHNIESTLTASAREWTSLYLKSDHSTQQSTGELDSVHARKLKHHLYVPCDIAQNLITFSIPPSNMRLCHTITWLLTATGLCQDSQPPVGTMTVPESLEYYPAAPPHETHPDPLARKIAQFKLREWDFVIVRTTYSSDAKWAEFLTILNDNIRFWFTLHNNQQISRIHEKHVLTVLEDPAKLNNASLDLTTRAFTDWVQSPQAKSEREGTVLADVADGWMLSPRYEFYIHADETTLNEVLRQHANREPIPPEQKFWHRSGYIYGSADDFSVKAVCAQQVQAAYGHFQHESAPEHGIYADTDVGEEELDENDMLDLMKRVRIFEIPDLYAVLANDSYSWFHILTWGNGNVMTI